MPLHFPRAMQIQNEDDISPQSKIIMTKMMKQQRTEETRLPPCSYDSKNWHDLGWTHLRRKAEPLLLNTDGTIVKNKHQM